MAAMREASCPAQAARMARAVCSHHIAGSCSAQPGCGAEMGNSSPRGDWAAETTRPVAKSRREALTAELPRSIPRSSMARG